ncbi:MAG: hypothetical protein MJ215_07440 [Spirochaetia bacterium]|nr:hypothetical protein [Spirochaetia bacterium]
MSKGAAEKTPADEYLIPGGGEFYLAGDVDDLPAGIVQMLRDNGVPQKIMERTDRYFCTADINGNAVLLEGDYGSLPLASYFTLNRRFSRHAAGNFTYFHNKETDDSYFFPDRNRIFYADYDIADLLSRYPDKMGSYMAICHEPEFSGLMTDDIYAYVKNCSLPGLNINTEYSMAVSAHHEMDFYILDSILTFATERQARVVSAVVKMFVVNQQRKYGIQGDDSQNIYAENNCLMVRGVKMSPAAGDKLLEYLISEIYLR